MNSSNIRFSIIIPVYNSEKYLQECVESVLAQDYKNYEIILVNDGSTDSSSLLCNEFQNKDSRIRVFHQQNQGSTGARKNAAMHALGEYVLSLDSDDFWDQGFLSKIEDELKKYDNPSILVFGLKQVDDLGRKVIREQKNDIEDGVYVDFSALRQDFMFSRKKRCINCGTMLYSICTKAVRRNLYVEAIADIPPNINFGDDLVLTKLMIDNSLCKSIAVSEYSGYCYRVNSDSMVHSGYSYEKLIKYETSISYFRILFADEPQKVFLFSLSVLINQLSILCEDSGSLGEFLEKARGTLKSKIIWENASRFNARSFSFMEKMKVIIIKTRAFPLFYLYFKRVGKKGKNVNRTE